MWQLPAGTTACHDALRWAGKALGGVARQAVASHEAVAELTNRHVRLRLTVAKFRGEMPQ